MKDLRPKNVQMNLQHGNEMRAADFLRFQVQSMVAFIRNVSFGCAGPHALASSCVTRSEGERHPFAP
jgi:hypothetical protein